MSKRRLPRLAAVLQALLVTFLWSTSFVLIKIALEDLPALIFAGLRYSLAFLCLLPFFLRHSGPASLRSLTGQKWSRLVILGILYYAVTQGATFLGLAHLPAITVTLLMNASPVVVALLAIPLIGERPTALQWLGIAVNVSGTVIYFHPATLPADQTVALIVVAVGVVANASSSILGRHINREQDLPPLTVTVVSMGVGAAVLLVSGLLAEGLPSLTPVHWATIGWLAVVNTAFAFTLWNHTLRTLTATESSVVNNTMLIQIAILAWLFLGERPARQEGIGMAVAGLGALIVHVRPRRSPR